MNPIKKDFLICRRCGEELHKESFRPLRKQNTRVCKACEYKEKYEAELRAQERRAEQFYARVRASRLSVCPDDE